MPNSMSYFPYWDVFSGQEEVMWPGIDIKAPRLAPCLVGTFGPPLRVKGNAGNGRSLGVNP